MLQYITQLKLFFSLDVSQHSITDVHMQQLSCWSHHAPRPLHNMDDACCIVADMALPVKSCHVSFL